MISNLYMPQKDQIKTYLYLLVLRKSGELGETGDQSNPYLRSEKGLLPCMFCGRKPRSPPTGHICTLFLKHLRQRKTGLRVVQSPENLSNLLRSR